ncbi:MAG: hypothetical protein PVG03_05190 [Desulfarculaceae bacterium]
MATIFEVRGPFKIYTTGTTKGSQLIKKEDLRFFWKDNRTFADRVGCYVFTMKYYGYVPWYVGKTLKGFKAECFTDSKRVKYNEVLAESETGQPYMFFVIKTNRGPIAKNHISQMEKHLIRAGYAVNHGLKNTHNTVEEVNWVIKNVTEYTRGRTPNAARQFCKMLGY